MNKKADMSINTIVAAALALIVLVILIFIFKDQIGNLAKGFTNTGYSAKGGISGKQCKTLLGDRICSSQYTGNTATNYDKIELPPPSCSQDELAKKTADKTGKYQCNVWTDCPANDACYEITKKATT